MQTHEDSSHFEFLDRLRELAESLVGDEWEHPVDAVETCRRAADEVEKLARERRTARYVARRLYDRLIQLGQVSEAREMATSWPWLKESDDA